MKKKKRIINTVILLLIAVFIASPLTAYAISGKTSNQIPYDSYTYWNYSASERKAVYCKPIYKTELVLDYMDMGAEKQLGKITDVVASKSGKLYILDGDMSAIYILNSDYKSNGIINSISNGNEKLTFKDARGIYVDLENNIYIADTENGRVIVCNENGELIKQLFLPDSKLIPDDFNFRPIKVAVDARGYMYVLSDGSYNGAILYSPEGEFLGFYGANSVKSSVTQVITQLWNKVIMTDEKRAASATVLPYQFTDICIDSNNFVYTATGNTNKFATTGQLRKLSPGGKDVIESNGYNYSDEGTGTYQQDMHGLDVDAQGFIYAIDSSYGHIFVYDQNNNLLGVFGSGAKTGTQDGSFTIASAITVNGNDVIVSDSTLNTVTVFKETDYGKLLKQAQILTDNGDYIKAKPLWNELIKQDKQNQLCYKGLAKAYLDEKNYAESLNYAKEAYDRDTYALAFKEIRNDWISGNFVLIIAIVLLLIISLIMLSRYIRKKAYGLNGNLKVMLSVWKSPGNTFEAIKYKNMGSVITATAIVLIYYVTDVMKSTMGGFCFTAFIASSYNAAITFLRTSGAILLFVMCFWAISALMSGLGKIKEIYVVVTYSMQPMIAANLIYVLLTNVMLPSEIGFLNIFMTVMTLYSAFLAIMGLIKVNDYSFGRFVAVTILTFVAMIVVIFVGTVIFLLMQLLIRFLKTVVTETNKIITFGG